MKHDIGRPIARSVCLSISTAVCHLFCLACRAIYRSSTAKVARGRPLLNRRNAVPVVLKVLHSRETMLCAIPNFANTLVTLQPSSIFPTIQPVVK